MLAFGRLLSAASYAEVITRQAPAVLLGMVLVVVPVGLISGAVSRALKAAPRFERWRRAYGGALPGGSPPPILCVPRNSDFG